MKKILLVVLIGFMSVLGAWKPTEKPVISDETSEVEEKKT